MVDENGHTQENAVHSLKYFLLWNGVFSIFTNDSNNVSFDKIWNTKLKTMKENGKTDDDNNNDNDSEVKESLFNECKTYIVGKFKKLMQDKFKLNEKEMEKLVVYCVEDIEDGSCFEDRLGIEYFIMNRLIFACYVNLFDKDNKDFTDFLFPNLRQLFETLMDVSIYNACFAHIEEDEKENKENTENKEKKEKEEKEAIDDTKAFNESFYVFEYFCLKPMLFDSQFLKQCKYFGGTLLHSAVVCEMPYYRYVNRLVWLNLFC